CLKSGGGRGGGSARTAPHPHTCRGKVVSPTGPPPTPHKSMWVGRQGWVHELPAGGGALAGGGGG
ncbi:hypothetical protein ABFP36_25115, partial [Salmonella enterica subsp. enterica serovar Kentucky]